MIKSKLIQLGLFAENCYWSIRNVCPWLLPPNVFRMQHDNYCTQGRIRGGGGGGRPPKFGKNMIFWRKIVIFHTKYPKNFRASLRNWKKYDFFVVKSWFFTRNTPTFFAPPSARRDFFKCAPPNLKSWIRPWYGKILVKHCLVNRHINRIVVIKGQCYDWMVPIWKLDADDPQSMLTCSRLEMYIGDARK